MNVAIAYACFSSAYYCAFDFSRKNQVLYSLEHVIFVTFLLDIILNLMRVQDSMIEGQHSEPSHLKILKKYAKSGWLFFDLLATFPFYLV
jgi:Ion transport protein